MQVLLHPAGGSSHSWGLAVSIFTLSVDSNVTLIPAVTEATGLAASSLGEAVRSHPQG